MTPGFRMHHSFVQLLSIPLTKNTDFELFINGFSTLSHEIWCSLYTFEPICQDNNSWVFEGTQQFIGSLLLFEPVVFPLQLVRFLSGHHKPRCWWNRSRTTRRCRLSIPRSLPVKLLSFIATLNSIYNRLRHLGTLCRRWSNLEFVWRGCVKVRWRGLRRRRFCRRTIHFLKQAQVI